MTRPAPFWLAAWLAVVLIASKAVLHGWPDDRSLSAVIDFCRDVAVMAHADVLFALAMGVAGTTAISMTARRPQPGGRVGVFDGPVTSRQDETQGRRRLRPCHPTRTERVVRAGIVLTCVASVIYGIISVQVFAYLRTPLTYPLIYVAGDMKNMRSSLGAFVTPSLLAALVAGPVTYLILVWASQRLMRPRPTRWLHAVAAAGLGAVLAYVAWGHHAYTSLPWCDRVDRRVAENPHWVLVKSFLTDLTSDGARIQLGEEFPPGHLRDFEIVADRTSVRSDRIHAVDDETPVASEIRRPDESGHYELAGRDKPAFADAGVKRPKNVIVYVLESVGAQHLSLYGSPYATTPCLEAEVGNSLVFDNFYAHCGVTANSLVAINLGIYPGLTWREYTVEQPNLPGTTVAALLKQRGYRTAYMTSGEIQYVNMDGFLNGRGYDLVCGYEYLGCGALLVSWGVEDRCLVDSLLRWIDRDRDQPFYAMVWTQQTHHPYEPSPGVPFIDFFTGLTQDQLPPDDYDLGRYLNTLREADRQLGRLFDGLRRLGVADDTLVVVTGDHGEGFGAPHDIYGHGGRVVDEIVRVPLVFWNPRLFGKEGSGVSDRNPGAPGEGAAHQRLPTPFSRRVSTIGGHIDLNPTLAEMLRIPAAGSWQGRSLFDSGRPPRAYFYAANDDYLLGVREHNWKYIYNATIGREQLFDLIGDPSEQHSVAGDYPDRCHELRRRLAAWVQYEEGHIARMRKPTPTRRVVSAGVAHGSEQ